MAQGLRRSSSIGRQFLGIHGLKPGSVALGLFLASLAGVWSPARAQFPPCPPPAANEYLLLVRGNTEAERTRVEDLLPSSSTVMVCDYLNDAVVRAGGFTNLENANAWAQYMTEVEGFQAFVARPATTATQPPPPGAGTTPSAPGNPPTSGTTTTTPPTTTPATNPATIAGPTAYAPQPLGTGFAVLVDYQYQPDYAIAIQRQVGQAVGLAVYRQRSYLLIAQSPDIAGAASTLEVLSSLNIPGFIVDSREVVMLTPAVALTE